MEIEAINFKTDNEAAAVIRAMHKRAEEREAALQKRIKRLEGTLRFYANKRNWKKDDWGIQAVIQLEYGDAGRRARKALGIHKRSALRRLHD